VLRIRSLIGLSALRLLTPDREGLALVVERIRGLRPRGASV
jgi:hypothetical protein